MKYDAREFLRYADMSAPRSAPSILADMLRCAVEEAERLRGVERLQSWIEFGPVNAP